MMPVADLNNVTTQSTYVDALTVLFAFPRPSFSVQVYNAAVFYQLAILGIADREASWEPREHMLVPSMNSFRNPIDEGFPEGSKFAGIRLRSLLASAPARVTVA